MSDELRLAVSRLESLLTPGLLSITPIATCLHELASSTSPGRRRAWEFFIRELLAVGAISAREAKAIAPG